jgi:hypothetical protein
VYGVITKCNNGLIMCLQSVIQPSQSPRNTDKGHVITLETIAAAAYLDLDLTAVGISRVGSLYESC